ncbi:MAG: GDSL-type esterase/lipase family protein, partial [Opitutus sp.]
MVISLPRLFIALVCFSTAAVAAPEKWQSSIDKFLAADAANPPKPGAVVFVGSSSIVKWKSLINDFPGVTVLNRGFGGSELADSVEFADEVVIPYQPRAVVLYAGDNDIAAGKTAENVLADFRAFRTKVHAGVPSARIYYLSIKYSPSRVKFQPAMRQANSLIAADCASTDYCTFVDVNSPLLDARGQPRP